MTGDTDSLMERIRQLEKGLKEAIRFVKPSNGDMLRVFSDGETDPVIRRRIDDIYEIRDRLADLLEDNK